MLDNAFDRDETGTPRRGPEPANKPPAPDREVPLAPAVAAELVHGWLDGELPEPPVVNGRTARTVEFWRRMEQEVAVRRRVVTPPYVADRIMSSIAELPAPRSVPWWRREVQLSTVQAVLLAIGCIALGVILSGLLR
ncbi:MAG TPA: hypothetical protein VNL96_05475 [Gemmatimonadaceae bacterium]|nr:hypothetical protein [Gemmatimonadaceae bacterium]